MHRTQLSCASGLGESEPAAAGLPLGGGACAGAEQTKSEIENQTATNLAGGPATISAASSLGASPSARQAGCSKSGLHSEARGEEAPGAEEERERELPPTRTTTKQQVSEQQSSAAAAATADSTRQSRPGRRSLDNDERGASLAAASQREEKEEEEQEQQQRTTAAGQQIRFEQQRAPSDVRDSPARQPRRGPQRVLSNQNTLLSAEQEQPRQQQPQQTTGRQQQRIKVTLSKPRQDLEQEREGAFCAHNSTPAGSAHEQSEWRPECECESAQACSQISCSSSQVNFCPGSRARGHSTATLISGSELEVGPEDEQDLSQPPPPPPGQINQISGPSSHAHDKRRATDTNEPSLSLRATGPSQQHQAGGQTTGKDFCPPTPSGTGTGSVTTTATGTGAKTKPRPNQSKQIKLQKNDDGDDEEPADQRKLTRLEQENQLRRIASQRRRAPHEASGGAEREQVGAATATARAKGRPGSSAATQAEQEKRNFLLASTANRAATSTTSAKQAPQNDGQTTTTIVIPSEQSQTNQTQTQIPLQASPVGPNQAQQPPQQDKSSAQLPPKQLAIYINGKIRSNSIFCSRSVSSNSFTSILKSFHSSGSPTGGGVAGPATTTTTTTADQVLCKQKAQGQPTTSQWSQFGGVEPQTNTEGAKSSQQQQQRASSQANSKGFVQCLVPRGLKSTGAAAPDQQGGQVGRGRAARALEGLVGAVCGCCEHLAFGLEPPARGQQASQFGRHHDPELANQNSPDKQEADCEQDQLKTYKLNPSSMFLRKAMRYYRLWIYFACLTIFLGALIFVVSALVIARDFRFSLLFPADPPPQSSPSTGQDNMRSPFYLFEPMASRAAANQTGLQAGHLEEPSGRVGLHSSSSKGDRPPDYATSTSTNDNDEQEGARQSFTVSPTEPIMIMAYLVILNQLGVLQAIGCFGAIQMKERLIQAFWFLILVLILADVAILTYWHQRYKTMKDSMTGEMRSRLWRQYGGDLILDEPTGHDGLGTRRYSAIENLIRQHEERLHASGGSGGGNVTARNKQAHVQDALQEPFGAEPAGERAPAGVAASAPIATIGLEFDKTFTQIFDRIQSESSCCGYLSPLDYDQSQWRQLKLAQLRQRYLEAQSREAQQNNEPSTTTGDRESDQDQARLLDQLLALLPIKPSSCCKPSTLGSHKVPPIASSKEEQHGKNTQQAHVIQRQQHLDDSQLPQRVRVPAWSPSMVVDNLIAGYHHPAEERRSSSASSALPHRGDRVNDGTNKRPPPSVSPNPAAVAEGTQAAQPQSPSSSAFEMNDKSGDERQPTLVDVIDRRWSGLPVSWRKEAPAELGQSGLSPDDDGAGDAEEETSPAEHDDGDDDKSYPQAPGLDHWWAPAELLPTNKKTTRLLAKQMHYGDQSASSPSAATDEPSPVRRRRRRRKRATGNANEDQEAQARRKGGLDGDVDDQEEEGEEDEQEEDEDDEQEGMAHAPRDENNESGRRYRISQDGLRPSSPGPSPSSTLSPLGKFSARAPSGETPARAHHPLHLSGGRLGPRDEESQPNNNNNLDDGRLGHIKRQRSGGGEEGGTTSTSTGPGADNSAWAVETKLDDHGRVLARLIELIAASQNSTSPSVDDKMPTRLPHFVTRPYETTREGRDSLRAQLASLKRELVARNSQVDLPNEGGLASLTADQIELIERYLDELELESPLPTSEDKRKLARRSLANEQDQNSETTAVHKLQTRRQARLRMLRQLQELVAQDHELGLCVPRSHYDELRINAHGCQPHINGWVEKSHGNLFVLGFCVLTIIKLCVLIMLRLEICEMIHKIRVLKGMATEYNALQDLEPYLPRPSICAQAAELTSMGVTSALVSGGSPTAGQTAALSMDAPQATASALAASCSSPTNTNLMATAGAQVGAPLANVPRRLGGSFSEAVAAATAVAHQQRLAEQQQHQLQRHLRQYERAASLANCARAASTKTIMNAGGCTCSGLGTGAMLSAPQGGGLCPCASTSFSMTAHLNHSASHQSQAQATAAALSSLRSDLFPPLSVTMPRRHTAISVCPAAAAAATAAAHQLMMRRGTYALANPLTFMNASQQQQQASTSLKPAGCSAAALSVASAMSNANMLQARSLNYLNQHRHSAHTVPASDLLFGGGGGPTGSSGKNSAGMGGMNFLNPSQRQAQPRRASNLSPGEMAAAVTNHPFGQRQGGACMARSSPRTLEPRSQQSQEGPEQNNPPFKRQASGGAQSAVNFSLDISAGAHLAESRRSIH